MIAFVIPSISHTPWKTLEANLLPLPDSTVIGIPYLKTQLSVNAATVINMSIRRRVMASLSFVKRSTIAEMKQIPFLDFLSGPSR